MSGGFSVTIEDLGVSATTFARLHTTAHGALGTAAGGLAPWRDADDPPSAAAAWSPGRTAAHTLHDIAVRLADTGEIVTAYPLSGPGVIRSPRR